LNVNLNKEGDKSDVKFYKKRLRGGLMKYVLSFVIGIILSITAYAEEGTRSWDVLNYELSIKIDFQHSGYEISENTLNGKAKITVKNTANESTNQIPMCLHRLMKVTEIRDAYGGLVDFSQAVRSLEGQDTYQVNYVQITLGKPLSSNETTTLQIDYFGHLSGYVETGMLYVKEALDPEFTIIRSETFAYPYVLYPAKNQLRLKIPG
jgi:hypothetical protein